MCNLQYVHERCEVAIFPLFHKNSIYKHKLIGHIDIKNYVQISVKNMNKELRMINIIK